MTAQVVQKRYGKRGFSRVSDAARGLIRKPLAKRGFAQARLLTEWDAVVGAEIAGLVRPLRLSHTSKEGMGGTLTLGVLGVRALEAQHQEPAIIERVNAHYGYRAVARIRLAQLGPEAFNQAKLEKTAPQPSFQQIEPRLSQFRTRGCVMHLNVLAVILPRERREIKLKPKN